MSIPADFRRVLEAGDPNYPIWSGCFWGQGELPAAATLPFVKLLETDAISLKLDDTPGGGGLTIEVKSPAVGLPIKIACTSSGVEISTGSAKVELTAASVSINGGALEVT